MNEGNPIRVYDGFIGARHGPEIATDAERSYDVVVTNTRDRLPNLNNLKPHRPPAVSDGTLTEPPQFRCADEGDWCRVHIVNGELRLYVFESIVLTLEC